MSVEEGKELLSTDEIKEIEETTRKIIDVGNDFGISQNLINSEITQADSLYEEMKTHWDTVKNYKPSSRDMNLGEDSGAKVPNTLSFIHQQSANLIALKQYKLALIKELTSIVKIKADLTLKEFIVILREKAAASDGNDGAITQMALKMVEIMMNDDKMQVFSGNPEVEDGEVTESLDNTLDARLEEETSGNKFDTGAVDNEPVEEDEVVYPYIQIEGLEERYRFVKDANKADIYVHDETADEYLEVEDATERSGFDLTNVTLEYDHEENLVETTVSSDIQRVELVEFE